MPLPTDLLRVFAPRLQAAGLRWMVAGGVASIVYGEPRFTQDLDVVLDLTGADAARVPEAFPPAEFYCPPADVIAEEAERPAYGHFNLLHLDTDARADVYLAGRDALARRGLNERRLITLVDLTVPIAPPEYVILHKLRFRQAGASERHLRDVRAMLRVLATDLDVGALEAEAKALGLGREWQEMRTLRD